MIPAPPMRRRFGVFAAMAFAERVSEFTSAAARIISLTRVTERVGSSASSWAATPETCGAAMLVPFMEAVSVLLEPTHAARMPWPGACAHAWRGLRVRHQRGKDAGAEVCGGWADGRADGRPAGRPAGLWREDMHRWEGVRGCGRCAAGEEDLHVDASTIAGERGQRAPRSGGANK